MEGQSKEQSSQEYLDSLKEAITKMEPVDRACAQSLVFMARIMAELINRRDWKTIAEMEEVVVDAFKQARQIKEDMQSQEQTEINPKGEAWFN